MKIIFFGTPEFAVESLKRLIDGGYDVAAVVTMPDKPAGRGHKLFQSPVKQYAESVSLPVLQPANLKDPGFIAQLQSYDADLFIVIAFRMLPLAVWQMPPLGTFNLHASLLPRYRGAAPINWAIINGDTVTGVTTFFLKHEIDTGDIIAQERIDILPDDDLGTVHDKLMELGATLTVKTVDDIIKGELYPIPQEQLLKGEEPTPAPKIFKEDCRIDWNKSAVSIHNLIRGLSPYPAAWTELQPEGHAPVNWKIFKSSVDSKPATEPGKITTEDGRLFVDANDYRLEILQLQPQGKKPMSAADYLRGARL